MGLLQVRILFVALVTLVEAVASVEALAAKRVALVVGNSAYKHAGVLMNPMNDAADVSAILKLKGFSVIEGIDLDKVSFVAKIQELAQAVKGAEIAAFFFAGHAIQVAGHNYLLPIDAKLATAAALDSELIAANTVYREMERGARFKIVVLDACRDNPLASQFKAAMGGRSAAVGRGLAREYGHLGVDSFISFSTQPGNAALDGDGRNSPFTSALVKNLGPANADDDIASILGRVRNEVAQETQQKQIPWDESSLRVRLYLDRAIQPKISEARLAWSKVNRQSYSELEAFISRYGSSPEGELAQQYFRMRTCVQFRDRKDCVKVSGSTQRDALRTLVPSFKDCPNCPEMLVMPWGHFQIGSPKEEAGREPGEEQVGVTMPYFFAVGRTRVTAEEWSSCVASGGCRALSSNTVARLQGTDPVVDVSPDDAKSYAKWLSARTGSKYRLLSDAEWEIIIRAGTTTAYWWGPTWDARPGDGATNPWGVRRDGPEWTEDCWNESNAGIPTDGRARTTGDCTRHVVRGSKDDHPLSLRSAHRSSAPSNAKGIGFRVVSTLLDR